MNNKILKILFIISAVIFLISVTSLPKTNCDACAIEYEGKVLNGVEAFQVFEDGCISYNTPWDNEINLTAIGNITIK